MGEALEAAWYLQNVTWGNLGPSRSAKTGLAHVTISVVSVQKNHEAQTIETCILHRAKWITLLGDTE